MKIKTSYFIATILLMLTCVACEGKRSRVTQNEEQDAGPRLVSTVKMSDTQASAQLLKGFHAIENGSWRWTAGNFSVLLRTPLAASERGATLNFAFTVPDLVIRRLKNVTLTASINGMMLKSAEYTAAGAYTFTADIPASLLSADSVKVDFALDKSLPPDIDVRQLGVIATSVGISPR